MGAGILFSTELMLALRRPQHSGRPNKPQVVLRTQLGFRFNRDVVFTSRPLRKRGNSWGVIQVAEDRF